jgi:hypothetical protein
MRILGIAAVVLCLGLVQPARADLVDVRTQQLRGGNDYKVRLSAVLWLAKKSDDRSIGALAEALASDPEHAIRRVAAGALGKLVTASTSAKVRERAVAALEQAIRQDRDSRVRRSAKRSLKRVAAIRPLPAEPAAPLEPAAQVFINVERPSLGKHDVPARVSGDLQERVKEVLKQEVPAYLLSWQSGRLPTKAELDGTRTRGWLVGASLSQLQVSAKGSMVEVRCAVTMRINRWEGRDTQERLIAHETASATGKGHVTARNSKRSIEGAARDCALAVAEQLTAKQVVPFLEQKNR